MSTPTRTITGMSNVLDRFSLAGKVAVVTRASSGLGAAFALGLGQAGADVVLGSRRADRLAATRDAVVELVRKAIAVTTRLPRHPDGTHPMGRTGDPDRSRAAIPTRSRCRAVRRARPPPSACA